MAVAFRLLLAVMLWDGPVVWGHQHAVPAEGLSEHLARYHADDANAVCLGWHWHVSPPAGDGSQSSDDEESGNRTQPKTVAESLVLSNLFDFIAALPCPGLSVCSAMVLPANSVRAAEGSYLATFSPGHSAQQMLCRLNC